MATGTRMKFTGRAGVALLSTTTGEAGEVVVLSNNKEIARGVKQALVWDSETPGLGVRCTKTKMTYVVQMRAGGKNKRVSLGEVGSMTVTEVRSRARRESASATHQASIEKGQSDKGLLSRFTLKEAFLLYLDELPGMEGMGKSLKPRTVHDVQRTKVLMDDWLDMPVRDLTGTEAARLHAKWAESSHAQANLHMRYLRAALNHANAVLSPDVGEPLMEVNPVDRISKIKRWKKVERRKTRIEVNAFPKWWHGLEEMGGKFNESARDYFRFLALTGCRPIEAFGLTWGSVDLEKGCFTFADTKNGRDLTLPCGPYLLTMLKRRRDEAQGRRVFANPDGTYPKQSKPSEQPFRNYIRSARLASGVSFTPTDLRREMASMLAERGHSTLVIKTILNHKSRAEDDVTAGYTVFDDKHIRRVMVQVEKTILKKAKAKT